MRVAVAVVSILSAVSCTLALTLALGCSSSKSEDALSRANKLAADARAGRVLSASGSVTARLGDGAPRPLAKDDIVLAGDTIETGSDGSVTLLLDHNNASLTLEKNMSRVLKGSAVWTTTTPASRALDKAAADETAVAGRQSEKAAADTAQTAKGLKATASAPDPTDTSNAATESPAPTPTLDSDEDSGGNSNAGPSDDPEPTKPTRRPDLKPNRPCDEVSCILDEAQRPCCAKFRKPAPTAKSGSDQPEHLSRTQLKLGIRKLRGRINACAKTHKLDATVVLKATFTVTKAGKVSQVTIVSVGRTELESCVTAVIRRAHFPKTAKGRTVTYPLRLKP